MALGALLKVKMDSTAVARGLRTIQGGFARLGSAMGRLRGTWGKLKGSAIGAVFGAIAQQVQKTAHWMVILRDQMAATGQSAHDLLQIREALELSGVEPEKASQLLNEMNKRLAEAAEPGGGGEAGKGLDILGLHIRDLFHLKGSDAFMQILRAVSQSEKNDKFLIKALDSLFGGEGGERMLTLARNLDKTMETARENTEGLAGAFAKKGAAGVTEMQIRMAKFRNSMRQFWMEFIGALPLGLVQKLLKAVAEALPKIITSLIAFFEDPMGEGSWLRAISDWFDGMFKRLMEFFYLWGENLKEFVSPLVKFLTGKPIPGKYDDLLPLPGKGPREGVFDQKILDEQKKQNKHLMDLTRRKAVWA